jgi:hypothetical protein
MRGTSPTVREGFINVRVGALPNDRANAPEIGRKFLRLPSAMPVQLVVAPAFWASVEEGRAIF